MLQKLSFGFFDNQKTGHLVARLTKDLEEIGEVAHHGPEDLFIAIMTLIGAFILMLWVHVPLALITAVIVPLTAWVTTHYGARMTTTWHALYGRVADFNARIEENVGGIRVVQAFADPGQRWFFSGQGRSGLSAQMAAMRFMHIGRTVHFVGEVSAPSNVASGPAGRAPSKCSGRAPAWIDSSM